MNDEGESSRAALRRISHASEDADLNEVMMEVNEEEDAREKEKISKERRLDAKRKRIRLLNELLRELDLVVYMELITLYYLDCSFFWLIVRAFIHGSLLTPATDVALDRPPDEPKPFLPLVLFSFAVNFCLHLLYAAPSAGEDTRGYLHGGLMIDFIGQQGPTSKWKLGGLDMCILLLQLVMVSVHVKRRELKKKLAKESTGGDAPTNNGAAMDTAAAVDTQEAVTPDNQAREQDVDSEERGLLRRTDSMSDIGVEPDEDDSLLPLSSEVGHVDALDVLASGQCVVGDFALVDTLLEENSNYNAYRRTRLEGTSDMPETLRRLNAIRQRFGVGGG
ncbi:DUF1746-domain-containing protein [Dothidotthia symphoricarpi CBS 119687]|uniref:DUF1746-domain-containing protein n=1 Tax=Dothidotthia symphoricarpi CBS 119687 TaxID=1392245 RepID=A0A6A6AM22_9PLEO|nr:DUF1746-domain-containing protein [Dothidotthia symphoricarpi CBS 119687]KAF2132178.1 DUF1746-domain-containing protein [Dothidotthia symphoricarpi CBS 119687]